MGLFDFFNKLLPIKPTAKGWRDASQKSGYGIKPITPVLSKDVKLCTHLNVPEKTRIKLEKLLIKNFSVRSEYLVDNFLQTSSLDITQLQFPDEIAQILNSRRKRGTCTEKQIIITYIRHELNKLINHGELHKLLEMDIKTVKIRSSNDSRVCEVCKSHSNKIYKVSNAPLLPLCWECRCYYEPQI